MAHWGRDEVALMNQVSTELDVLFEQHDLIKSLLPSLESYSNPFVHMQRNDLAEEGGPLDQQTAKVLSELDRLLEMQEAKRRELGGGMIRSFDSLKFFVLYMGIALVVIGVVVAFVVVRDTVSYTHLRAHETVLDLVCRLLLEKKTTAKTGLIYPHKILHTQTPLTLHSISAHTVL